MKGTKPKAPIAPAVPVKRAPAKRVPVKAVKPKPKAKPRVAAKKVATVRKRSTVTPVSKLVKRAETIKKRAGTERSARVKAGVSTVSLAGEPSVPEIAPAPSLDVTLLPMKWQLFIEEYLIDLNAKQSAIRAGYTPSDADNRGPILLHHPQIAPIIQARIEQRIEAIRMTRERVLDAFADIAEADANELSEHRRVCCRFCHGAYDQKTGARSKQLTPSEWVRRREVWDDRRADGKHEKKRDIGVFKEEAGDWYDKRMPINPECNECFGDGIGEVVLKDTRTISRRARMSYQGVKEGKDGIEIKSMGRGEALGVLAKHHKIYDEPPQVSLTTITGDQLEAIYAKGVADSEAAKLKVLGRGERVREKLKLSADVRVRG